MKAGAAGGIDYDQPLKIADGVYWVGFYDESSGLHCNPYLVVDGDEAVVIDGGSRPHFPMVIMKIMQAGIAPASIRALIYQHYDPDLVGSVHNFEALIGRPDLQIISAAANEMFIRHYCVQSPLVMIEHTDHEFLFSSGRRLQFVPTPYAHSQGSFVTLDTGTGVLFSSDLFGSHDVPVGLGVDLAEECLGCSTYDGRGCGGHRPRCPLGDICGFHRQLMPSGTALRHALAAIARLPFSVIAPQHGGVLRRPQDILKVFGMLSSLDRVGIDAVVAGADDGGCCSLEMVRRRLEDAA